MKLNEPLSDNQEPDHFRETATEADPLEADPLWLQVRQRSLQALECGALQPIPTHYEFVEQNGITFLVRILSNLKLKEQARKQQQALQAAGKDFNPFLPYEEDLFVTHLSSTHVCLLNKFNVVDHHVLIVTREFEHQNTWLKHQDFFALWQGLRQIDGLAFYNGGTIAGASQQHKHLQLVPLPVVPGEQAIPVETVLPLSSPSSTAEKGNLPFYHGLRTFNLAPHLTPQIAATSLLNHYWDLLNELGLQHQGEGDRHTHPYNLLVTRRWMLLVPRSQEKAYNISINALGFAGSLFVKNMAQLDILKNHGPMALLQSVTYPQEPPFLLSNPLA
ncbi:MAG: phosphorylase [Leptolyngbyaceae bacterium]|nr:phosphorylase [Leptolyngbyaceae bacterium]